MQKINSEILERKITFLFFENPKRTFNVKQIKYFIGAKINDQEFFKILFSIARKGYIVDGGRGKYTYNKNKKYLVGKISRRVKYLIDLDTSTEDSDEDDDEILPVVIGVPAALRVNGVDSWFDANPSMFSSMSSTMACTDLRSSTPVTCGLRAGAILISARGQTCMHWVLFRQQLQTLSDGSSLAYSS